MGDESTRQEGGVPIVIQPLEDDTEGHLWRRSFVSEEDEQAIQDALTGRAGPVRVRLEPVDEDDTEGHIARATQRVRLSLGDDDTEGHIISLHFPSAEAAAAFRRRLIVSGAVAATLAVGALAATALPSMDVGGSAPQTVVSERAAAPDRDIGLMDTSAGAAAADVAAGAQREARDLGLMDASGAGAAAAATGQERGADSDIGIMDASGAAPAGAAQERGAESDIGIMDASGAPAGSQAAEDEPEPRGPGPR